MKYASLCVLSYNRLDHLKRSLESLWATVDYPYELIIHDDSDKPETRDYIFDLVKNRKISYALFNGGKNMGIGHAMNCCTSVSHGEYIFKLDPTLEYKKGWLSTAIRILDEDKYVGAVGLFKYHLDPVDCKKMYSHTVKSLTNPFGFEVHHDFLSSAIGFRREMYNEIGKWEYYNEAFSEDINYKMLMKKHGYMLALPIKDMATNFAFNRGKASINYFDNCQLKVRHIVKKPLIF